MEFQFEPFRDQKSLQNTIVTSYRVRTHFGDLKILSDPMVKDDDIYLIDSKGHVHHVKWRGRLIDQTETPRKFTFAQKILRRLWEMTL